MNYGFLFDIEEHYARDVGFSHWTGYHKTIVGGDDTMGSNGHTCLFDTGSSQLLYAAHELRNAFWTSTTNPSGDVTDDVTTTTQWLGPQYAWEDAPSGDPFGGQPSTHVSDGHWQARTGPDVLHPYDGCCEASIPDAVTRTTFHVKFEMVVIKETKVQRYINGIPVDHPWNELTREWDHVVYSVWGIYRGDDACDGVTALVCDGKAKLGAYDRWSMCIESIPTEVAGSICPSALTRIPKDISFRYNIPGAPYSYNYTGKSRFRITNMSFS